jgi:hypothetical protein
VTVDKQHRLEKPMTKSKGIEAWARGMTDVVEQA